MLPLYGWTHLVGTYNGTTLRLYRNGVQVASSAQSGWVAAPSTAAIRIGTKWDTGDVFPGRIDEVALYDTTLNTTQIQAHYNLSLPVGAPPSDYRGRVLYDAPVGYWRLGEPSGTVAADASTNGLTGTYVGSPTLAQVGALGASGDADTAVDFTGGGKYVSTAADKLTALNPAGCRGVAHPPPGRAHRRGDPDSRLHRQLPSSSARLEGQHCRLDATTVVRVLQRG